MDVVEWLESPDGEAWSQEFHKGQGDGGRIVRHSHGMFAAIKQDHECAWDRVKGEFYSCGPSETPFGMMDMLIRSDIAKYGLTGLPHQDNGSQSAA